jgi:hypothetical protein
MDFAKLFVGEDSKVASIKKEDLQLLQEMFKGSDFTASVYATVLKENKGELDSAIDTLLNLANDPLLDDDNGEQQPQQQQQLVPASKPIAIEQSKKESSREDVVVEMEEIPPVVMLSPRDVVPLTDHQVEQEDARLLEEMRLLEEEKRVDRPKLGSSPGGASFLSISPTPTPSPSPISASAPIVVASPPKLKEVLSVLQTQEIMSSDLEAAAPDPPSNAQAASLQETPSPMRKLVCPTSARLGDVVGVSWDLGSGCEPSSGDWIGLFKQNQPSNTQYVVYKKTGGAQRGILDVAAPGVGTWEFRFFPNNSYDYVMKSNLLIVGPQLELEASLDEGGDTIEVSCKLLSGQVNPRDWIGLYKVETYHNKQYLDLRYVGSDVNARLSFPAPKTPGHYELRYFPVTSSYNDVARSNLITIENRDMVIATPSRVVQDSGDQLIATWQIYSVPTSKWDWVGLYPVGSSTYVEYHYVDPLREPTCIFAVPKQPGQYELRYFASATSSFLSSALERRSTKVTVLPASTADSRIGRSI